MIESGAPAVAPRAIHIAARRARHPRRPRWPDDLDRCLNLGSRAARRRPVLLPRLVRDDGRPRARDNSHQPRSPRRDRSRQRHRHADVRPPANASRLAWLLSTARPPHLRVSAPPREKNSIAAPARYNDPAMTIDEYSEANALSIARAGSASATPFVLRERNQPRRRLRPRRIRLGRDDRVEQRKERATSPRPRSCRS